MFIDRLELFCPPGDIIDKIFSVGIIDPSNINSRKVNETSTYKDMKQNNLCLLDKHTKAWLQYNKTDNFICDKELKNDTLSRIQDMVYNTNGTSKNKNSITLTNLK